MAAQSSTPQKNVDAEEFADRYALNSPIDGVFDAEDGEIDTCGQPGPLIALVVGHGIEWKSTYVVVLLQDRNVISYTHDR